MSIVISLYFSISCFFCVKIIVKKCKKCQLEKSEDCFHKSKNKKGDLVLRARCKECVNAFLREKYENEKAYHIERNKKWSDNNPEKVAAIKRKYYLKNKNKFKKASQKWVLNNRKKASQNTVNCNKKRYKIDPAFRLERRIRNYVYKIAKTLKINKTHASLHHLGCSIEELKNHIESQWQENMTWENYGLHGWHIDHIKPLSFFIKNSNNPWEANHYTNLQPLWSIDNLKKSNSLL